MFAAWEFSKLPWCGLSQIEVFNKILKAKNCLKFVFSSSESSQAAKMEFSSPKIDFSKIIWSESRLYGCFQKMIGGLQGTLEPIIRSHPQFRKLKVLIKKCFKQKLKDFLYQLLTLFFSMLMGKSTLKNHCFIKNLIYEIVRIWKNRLWFLF